MSIISDAHHKNLPFVTVIVPIRNEERYIERCLKTIFQQDYRHDCIEILVVDGCSTDRTRAIVQSFLFRDIPLRLLDNPGKIVPTGMNIALRQARGAVIVRVDGHCEIAPDYVTNCVRHLENDQVDGVGGPMQTIGEDPLSRVIAAAMSSKFGVGGSTFRTAREKTALVDTIPFPAYTRQIIERVGLYDEEFIRNQDDEYNYRIRKNGGKILLATDVQSKYYSRGSLTRLWKQYFQYGYWKVRVLQKHPKQMSLRQFVPPAFVLSLFLAIVVTIFVSRGWIALIAFLGAYFIANGIASAITGIRQRPQMVYLLPVCFSILHFSYGLGFLSGLIKFRNRWHINGE